ncbi:hypothetical protein ACQ86N_18335 [Puia sp. P3]|uniref:hypothetical protein n=1 Tax=Puia sp. P3 TaxID=3423952 RepID=UPI003D66D257
MGPCIACSVTQRQGAGERLLDHMFRNPLSEAAAINERSEVFRCFQRANLKFPFDVQQVSLMREYLDAKAGKYPAVVYAKTLVKRMLSSLVRDDQFKKNLQGLQATILLLNKCYAFVQKNDFGNCAFGGRSIEIKRILSEKALEKIRNTNIYKDLGSRSIAFFDTILKGRLHHQMESILSFIYEIDVNIAVSEVAARRGFCYAKALPGKANILSVSDVSHPCVSNAVGNSIELGRDQNVLFLTGANMAGKIHADEGHWSEYVPGAYGFSGRCRQYGVLCKGGVIFVDKRRGQYRDGV